MKYRMLKTAAGSPDGIRVETYLQGQDYVLDASLASVFLKIGVAEPVDLSVPPERAVIEKIPEVKAKPKKGK